MNAALNHIQAKPTSQIGTPIFETSKITLVLALELNMGSLKRNKNARRATMLAIVVKNMDARHPNMMAIRLKRLRLAIVPKGMAVLNIPIPKPNSLCINHCESN